MEYSERQSCVTSTQFSGSFVYHEKMEVDKPLYICCKDLIITDIGLTAEYLESL